MNKDEKVFYDYIQELATELYRERLFWNVARDLEIDFSFDREGFINLAKKIKASSPEPKELKSMHPIQMYIYTFIRIVDTTKLSPVDDEELFVDQFTEALFIAIEQGKKVLNQAEYE